MQRSVNGFKHFESIGDGGTDLKTPSWNYLFQSFASVEAVSPFT